MRNLYRVDKGKKTGLLLQLELLKKEGKRILLDEKRILLDGLSS